MNAAMMILFLLAASARQTVAGRLDVALVARGMCTSRAVAKSAVTAGLVKGNGKIVTKAAHACDDSSELFVSGAERYVSRAGDKLHTALEAFQVDLHGATTLDVGASTGGFTDCMLTAGAAQNGG